MKASLKFREEEKKKPLVRAKVPLNILGFPFQSGVVAGESKELTLNLSTHFLSGPSLKLSYRPNDPCNPFSLQLKTGTGQLGSPFSGSTLRMTAEFDLPGPTRGHCPRFILQFKPQFGDFCVKKTQSSSSVFESKNDVGFEDRDVEFVEGGGKLSGKKITVLPLPARLVAVDILSGIEVAARTRLPVRTRAVVSFRWGVRVPSSGGGGGGGVNWGGIGVPFLAMNKIGIENVVNGGDDTKRKSEKVVGGGDLGNAADLAELCLGVKRQLEVLQSENEMLRKAVDDLRQEISGSGNGGVGVGNYREIEQSRTRNAGGGGGKIEKRGGGDKKSVQGDTKGNVSTSKVVGV